MMTLAWFTKTTPASGVPVASPMCLIPRLTKPVVAADPTAKRPTGSGTNPLA